MAQGADLIHAHLAHLDLKESAIDEAPESGELDLAVAEALGPEQARLLDGLHEKRTSDLERRQPRQLSNRQGIVGNGRLELIPVDKPHRHCAVALVRYLYGRGIDGRGAVFPNGVSVHRQLALEGPRRPEAAECGSQV